VACITIALTDRAPSRNLLMAALFHDLLECIVGDLPRNAKVDYHVIGHAFKSVELELEEKHGLMVELTIEESIILKQADIFDMLYYVTEEQVLGNMRLENAFENGVMYLSALELNPNATRMLEHVKARFEDGRK